MKFQANFQPNNKQQKEAVSISSKHELANKSVFLPDTNMKQLVPKVNRDFLRTYLEPIWVFQEYIISHQTQRLSSSATTKLKWDKVNKIFLIERDWRDKSLFIYQRLTKKRKFYGSKWMLESIGTLGQLIENPN